MADESAPMPPGWAESLGRQLAIESAEHAALRAAGKRPMRRSWTQDFAAGVRGSEQGHAARRVDRALAVLPPLPEGLDGESLEP